MRVLLTATGEPISVFRNPSNRVGAPDAQTLHKSPGI